mgnify:FL=1
MIGKIVRLQTSDKLDKRWAVVGTVSGIIIRKFEHRSDAADFLELMEKCDFSVPPVELPC